jgi:hypothetical protein
LDYRNSGIDRIYYHMLTRGAFAWSTATEMTIENNTRAYSKGAAGGMYDMFPPTPPASDWYKSYASGDWNQARVVAKGDSVEHWMNGEKVLGFRYWNEQWIEAYQTSKWSQSQDKAQESKGCRCFIRTGYVGFQGDWNGTWHIRNLRINADSAKVAFGPDVCATPVRPGPVRLDNPYIMKKYPGEIRLVFTYARTSSIKAMDLEGRSLAFAEISAEGKEVVIRGWQKSSLILLHILLDSGDKLTEKVWLP